MIGGMRRFALVLALGSLLAGSCVTRSAAQSQDQSGPRPALDADLPDAPEPREEPAPDKPVTVSGTPRAFLHDQAAIWTVPFHLQGGDLAAATVLTLGTAVVVTTDHQVMSQHAPTDKSLQNHAVTASDAGVAVLAGIPVGLFALGSARKNTAWRETGILAGEAMADGYALTEGIKLATWRERPNTDGTKGKFFQKSAGWDSSFPSSHAVIAWSAAAVMARESDNLLVKLGVYGVALGVSAARVVGQQHFPSDVLVGSSLGWLVGRYVYNHHHFESYDE